MGGCLTSGVLAAVGCLTIVALGHAGRAAPAPRGSAASAAALSPKETAEGVDFYTELPSPGRRPVPEVTVLEDVDGIYDGDAAAVPESVPSSGISGRGSEPSGKVVRGHGRWAHLHRAEPAAEEAKGYPALLAAEGWPERLQEVAGAPSVRQDPCGAEYVLLGLSWPFGFGSRVTTLINEVFVAMYFGLPISMCRGGYASSVWEKHFENRAGLAMCTASVCSEAFALYPNGGWSHEIKEKMCFAQGLARQRRNYTRDLKRFIASSIFSLNSATQEHVENVLQDIGLLGQRFAGVHIRHGDSGYDGRTQWEASAYAERLRPHLEQSGIRAVFVASDDDRACDLLHDALGAGYTVVQQPRLDPESYLSAGPERDEAALLALLVDVEVLRRSEVFVDTATGNLGRVVYYLRNTTSGPSVGINGDFMDPPVEDVFRDCTKESTY